MGDPRKIRKKYQTPAKRWEKARIDAERPLLKSYGLKNKRELWKVSSLLRGFTAQAKALVARTGAQAEKEQQQLISRLRKYGLIQANVGIDGVLSLKVEDLLDRRLQTLVFKKGLAKTIYQARQMITHEHISVGGKKVTAPSYLVPTAQEADIVFSPTSLFADPEHPERIPQKSKGAEESA